jgi:hypothetical protein
MMKPSQNDTKTATKQDATPVSDAQPYPSPSTAQGDLTGSRFASDIPKSAPVKEVAKDQKQSERVAKVETPQKSEPNAEVRSAPVTSVTKVGLGFSRYSSTPLPIPGEQTTKISQQPQTPKKQQTSQVVLPKSDASEFKPKASQPTMSLLTLSLGNTITPSTSTELASSAAGPVSDNSQQFCKTCNKSVAKDTFKDHCEKHHGFCLECGDEVSGIWNEHEKFYYDAHKGVCVPKPKPTPSPSRPQDIGMPTIRRKDPKSRQHKSLRGSGHRTQPKQQNFRSNKSGYAAWEGKVIVYS